MKRNCDIKIIKASNIKNINIKNKEDYVGMITMKENEQYFWDYNGCFEKDKFIKPYDCLDWVVIGPTQFSSKNSASDRKFEGSYKLSEGDLIKLGKIIFLVRKVNTNIKKNETQKVNGLNNESFSSNSVNNNSNANFNVENSMNEEIAINIYNRKYIYDINDLLQSEKTLNIEKYKNKEKNDNDNKRSNLVNNKLKYINLKLKNINEKRKEKMLIKCRVCFCEGNFEGKNPLISPCNCTGSVKYIHLNCLRKWLTSKVNMKCSQTNNIYCYTFKSLECEICKALIPEQVEYRGKFISLLDFKEIEPPYLILQTMNQYNPLNKNLDFNIIFVMSFKIKNFLIIGRANNSDIRLSDISVSRNHSVISFDNGEFFIDDIGSKFGTLLLIQNNILFLPYKEISIQTGKCHLVFYLMRTFLGCFKCIKNKIFENLSYEEYFNINEKKVYLQIMENIKNNNIVDPIEKFNSISDSYNSDNNINDENENNNNIISDNANNLKINSLISEKNLVENSGIDVGKRPTLNINLNDLDNKENNIGNFITKNLCNSLSNENNNVYNSFQRQNESNDMLFHDLNNNTNIKPKNQLNDFINFNLSDINIINNKRNFRNRKYTTVTNKFYDIIKGNFKFSLINKSKNKYKKNEVTNIKTDNKANEDQKVTINNY